MVGAALRLATELMVRKTTPVHEMYEARAVDAGFAAAVG
jgi:hypothetical protein